MFSGLLFRCGGVYQLTTLDGDISFEMPPGAGAEFSVATYSGEFETELPIVVQRLERGGELNFEVGGGGAQVRLRAFDGAIRLLQGR